MPRAFMHASCKVSCHMQISIPQVKSLYQSSAHISQPCAPGSVSHSLSSLRHVPLAA